LKNDHGVLGYLDESFSAPDPVMQALRSTSNVHAVLVGSSRTQASLDRHGLLDYLAQREDGRPGLMNSCIFSCHNNKKYKYLSQISRYSGKSGLRVDEVIAARMLAAGTPPEQKEKLKRNLSQLQQEKQELEPTSQRIKSEHDEILGEGQTVSAKLKEIRATLQDIKRSKQRLNDAKRKLEDYEKTASADHVADKQALLEKLKYNIANATSAMMKAGEKHEELMSVTCALTGVKMTEDGIVASARKLTEALRDSQAETEHLETRIAKLTHDFNAAKNEMKQLKAKADREAPMKDARGNDLPLKAQLEELPETLTEVEAALEEASAKVESIYDNPEVLQKYEERKREIEETKREMEGLSKGQDVKKEQLKRILVPWEAALDNTASKVNALFTKYMQELGCAGEIHLTKGNHSARKKTREESESSEKANFKDWGIEIRVKFREKATLQVLSAQVQSGGERSVSTIMYLMALQELMVSPFRCVDEINQGLDERNERLVFKRIVINSTKRPKRGQEHCGQYFLITPKLLPNLTDMEVEDITVLFVFNGPYNFGHFRDWDVDGFLNGREQPVQEEKSAAEDEEVAAPSPGGKRIRGPRGEAIVLEDEMVEQEERMVPPRRSSSRSSRKRRSS